MKKHILLLTLCLLPSLLSAAMGIGSARQLEGKIYVLSIFISDSEWSSTDKDYLLKNLYSAEDWLTAQAAAYGKEVTFVNGQFGYENSIMVDRLPKGTGSGNESVDVVYETMQRVGWANPPDFISWARDNAGCPQVVAIVFANTRGRSYAMGYAEGYTKTLLEGALVYRNYEDGQNNYSASIAHEMLHLFGAWDLYETFEQSAANAERASSLYPDDIMRRIAYDINDLNIGEVTAWRIGIGPYSRRFEEFKPGR